MNTDFNQVVGVLKKARNNGVSIFLEHDNLKLDLGEQTQIDPELLQEIKQYKKELIDFLRHELSLGDDFDHSPIPIRAEKQEIPLSYGQKGLWMIDQLNGSTHYHMPMYFRLSGKFNTDALELALKEVVNRHEILRTVIRQNAAGQPMQCILEKDRWSLNRMAGYQGGEAGLTKLLAALAAERIDLKTDHMLRAHLIRISDQEHVLVIILHHIAADGWSLSILIKELIALYQMSTAGLAASLPPMALQYGDYSIWQRAQEESHWGRRIAYWKDRLVGTSPLELPIDYPRPAIQSTRGAMAVFPLGAKLSAGLQSLARQHGATLHMVLLSAIKILFYRYSGQDDICVGSVIAGRTRQELEELIGFFANTLALRSNLSGNPSFVAFLQQVKETTLSAYEYQDVPFERVVETVGQERDKSRNPLYQVIFTVQNIPEVPVFRLGEAVLKEQKTGHSTSQFDLNISAIEGTSGIEVGVEYCTDLFKGATIDRMFRNYLVLLQAIVLSPSQKIDQLQILRKAEQEEVLNTFNARVSAYPGEQTLVGLFSAQALQTPDAIALVYLDERLTYKELDEKSNQLGHYLRCAGVREDTLVPICITRSVDMMIGILGILKAGGAYVPIDSEYPQERISYILSDTKADVVVSSEANRLLLSGYDDICVISLDGEREVITQEPITAVATNLRAHHLCYVMYTSGSTGQPKGVLVTHSNVISLVSGANYIKLSSRDALLSAGSPSFDATTFEYWGMWLNGGRLVLCPASSLLDNNLLKAVLRLNKITVMWFTAGWFNQLVDVDIDLFEGLLSIMVGGEKLSVAHVNRFRQFYPDKILINGYGPTENTTFSLTYQLTAHQYEDIIPIGRPLRNRQAYILDNDGQPVPIGVSGEIYVGGAGVARGYLNQDALTSARFIPDVFGKTQGGRLYKTGDIGRWLADGNIEFIGRRDDQVKIRGYRIELGEIENIIQQSGLVSQCIVLAPADESGQKRLVGYVVAQRGQRFDRDGLITYLQARLPDYMVPQVLMELEAFPLTANGKVNKKGLADAQLISAEQELEVSEQLTQTEQKVKEIWALSLGIETLSIHDDFFKLGGDSIVAIGVISRLRKAFNDTIRLYDLYECSTVSSLAALIDSGHIAAPETDPVREVILAELDTLRLHLLPQLKQQMAEQNSELEIEDIYPMSAIQSGMVYTSQLNPEMAIYHDQITFKLPQVLEQDVFEQVLKRLVSKHSILRTRFDLHLHTQGIQVVYSQGDIHVEYHDVRDLKETELSAYLGAYLAAERTKPFEVHQGSLWRMNVFQTLKEHILLFQFHHAMLDGWSVASFATELNNLYVAQVQSKAEVELPLLKASYRDFVIESISEQRNEENRKFWVQSLSDYKRLDIFTDTVIDDNLLKIYEVGYLNRLKAKTQADGLSLKGVFLGAYQYMLSMLTVEQEVTVGVVTNGRPITEDGDKVLGCFLNTIPFRFIGSGPDVTWKAYFQEIEQQLISLKERDRVPLSEIARLIGEQASSGNPFFDTIFNYINFHVFDQMDGIAGLFVQQDHLEAEADALKLESSEVTNTHLDCTVSTTGNVLAVNYRLGKELRSGKTLADIHVYFDAVLDAYLDQDSLRIADVPVLTAQELAQLSAFNATAAAYPMELTLVDLFALQVAQCPDAVALIYKDQQLTYRELDQQSNQLGHYLRSMGVKEDMLVPVCIDRSLDMIIGILGILKAGGAYVPVDPDYPQERISYLLEDTRARIVVSNAYSRNLLGKDIQVVSMDEDWTVIDQESAAPVVTALHAAHLCYVIYTSGSTGKPKGVLIEHRSVHNMVFGWQKKLRLTNADRVLLFSSYTFDAAVEQMFMALLNGAGLVLIPKEVQMDADAVISVMNKEKVTYMLATPGFLRNIPADQVPPGLRHITAGGERCGIPLAQSWTAESALDFHNAYGPTECTVFATTYQFKRGWNEADYLPIGKPASNVQLYLLDSGGNLLPAGVPGEICIGGFGVARGYLNQPELTSARFVADPFGNTAGGRLYKTGDIGRWLPDGNIEFIGRMDDQVKVRGYRIELGEIENAVQQSDFVSQSVVLTRADESGSNHLVCYVVPEGSFAKDNLVSYLETQLPEYMVPRVFVELETMPLTSHGKLDKKALPSAGASVQQHQGYVAARNELESELVAIWEELLHVSPVGIHDSFFDLGGHSLLAMRVMNPIRKLGYKVQMQDLLVNTTISTLAGLLQKQLNQTNNEHLVLLNSGRQDEPVFIIPGSDGICDGYDELGKNFEDSGAVYGLQMMGLFKGEKPLDNIAAIAAMNISWIKSVQPAGPYRLIGHSFGGKVVYEMTLQLERQGEQVDLLAILDAATVLQENVKPAGNQGEALLDLLNYYHLIQTPYPHWTAAFLTAVKDIPEQELSRFMADFLTHQTDVKEEDAAFILRLLDLQFTNVQMDYPVNGEVKALTIIVKTEDEDWTGYEQGLGWEKHAGNAVVYTVPGTHFSMVKGKEAITLAACLKTHIICYTDL
ncbi:non-ribosomal peptide synthetase [Pedobacter cryoconitis]|uniref:Amino acid adenylation domain-containing protein n=1 Tax=Pedobacter cryoconitis TaxID=188932 RepID=A0A327SKX7_9SPHI|nr:non-ribosomal peptide synthetase [Pedobacter cryoconitis]RAJ29155.1 amino acid adenylation domain-containing protein [Pedobacter cryoconitis]